MGPGALFEQTTVVVGPNLKQLSLVVLEKKIFMYIFYLRTQDHLG